jgi:hypothetical protein
MIRVPCIKCARLRFGASNGTSQNRTGYLLQHRTDHLLSTLSVHPSAWHKFYGKIPVSIQDKTECETSSQSKDSPTRAGGKGADTYVGMLSHAQGVH